MITMVYSVVVMNTRARWKVTIIQLKIDRVFLTIIGIYAREVGKKEETQLLFKELQKQVNKSIKNYYIIITDYINAWL